MTQKDKNFDTACQLLYQTMMLIMEKKETFKQFQCNKLFLDSMASDGYWMDYPRNDEKDDDEI